MWRRGGEALAVDLVKDAGSDGFQVSADLQPHRIHFALQCLEGHGN